MNRVKTKAEIRRELAQEVDDFLHGGGAIESVQQGVSGKELGANLNNRIPLNHEKQTRTLLTEEVNALDARKQKSKPEPVKKSRPKKRIIYDDFGEPLREVWEE